MKIFLLAVIGIYLIIDIGGSFSDWIDAKSGTEYVKGCVNTLFSCAAFFALTKLINILISEVE